MVPGSPLLAPASDLLNFKFIDGQWVCTLVAGSARGVVVDMFGWDVKEMWLSPSWGTRP